jgi:hypothetical protein
MTDRVQLQQAFEGSDWRELAAEASSAGLVVFASSYAAVGVVLASSVTEVASTWRSHQSAMSRLREEERMPRNVDLYLLFVVPSVDRRGASILREITSDTHVCRKLCLERDGRSLRETLGQAPFLKLGTQADGRRETEMPRDEPEPSSLPPELLGDLARRSAEVVLRNVIEGKYSKAPRNG